MTNGELARRTIAEICSRGVNEFCVCSGSRNAPLLAALGATRGVRLFSFIDERSAAFFALGRAKLTRRPAAVVTTSGTAAAELLPAAIEAHYSGTPLVLVTADRPSRYRGTGAPQAIVQDHLFGRYAATCAADWDGASALHVNVEFDEPLIDEPIVPWEVACGVPLAGRRSAGLPPPLRFANPVVIIGGLLPDERAAVRDFVLRLSAPVYAEPPSGLREDEALRGLRITAGEPILHRGGFDSVIRVGNVPALRFWRDLDESRSELGVVSFSRLPFPGLCRGGVWPIEALALLAFGPCRRNESFFALDRSNSESLQRILDEEPLSELSMIRALSLDLPHGSRVYLGNSLPVREWDLAATRNDRGFVIEANRGANGIDGQLSTFFGQCGAGAENVALLGDLTALYDLNAPWIVPQLDPGVRFRIVIVNNRGGRIFERVSSLRPIPADIRGRVIDNGHDLRFDSWASMFGLGDAVVELRPDLDASRRAWQRYEALWA